MIGCASSMPQKSTVNVPPRRRAPCRARRRRAPGRRRTGARSHARVGTTQPKQAPKPQAMPDSSASCAGTPRSAQMRPHRLEHRRRPAGEDLAVRARVELVAQQVGDEAVVADAAVVGGERAARRAARRRRVRARRGSRAAAAAVGRPSASCRSPAARSRPRRRPAARGDPARAAPKPLPERSDEPSSSPGASSHSRAGAGPTSSSRKSSAAAVTRAREHAERARQERPLVLSPAPPLARCSACRTGRDPGADRRGRAAQHDVGAVPLDAR